MQLLDRFLPSSLRGTPGGVRRGRFLVAASFALVPVALITILIRLWIGPLDPAVLRIALGVLALVGATPWILRATGSLRLAALVMITGTTVGMLSIVFFTGGVNSPTVIFLPLLPLLASFFFSVRHGVLVALLVSAAVAVFVLLAHFGPSPRPLQLDPDQMVIARGLLSVSTLFLTILFAGLYERQRAEAERTEQAAEQLYRRLFEQSKDIVALSTPEGRLLDINRAGVEIFEFESKEDMLRVDLSTLYADPARRSEFLREIEEHGFVQGFEMVNQTRDGRPVILQATTSTVRGDDGHVGYMLAILRDITVQRTAEIEREALIKELAEKNSELERFTHTVSHDLKSPLITIKGFLGLLERDLRDGSTERAHKDLAILGRTAEQMQRLLDDLLEFSRVGQAGRPWSLVDLGALAREAVEMVSGRLIGQDVDIEISDQLPVIRGDTTQLRLIFQNLIDNAIKYSGRPAARHNGTDQGLRVEVGMRREAAPPSKRGRGNYRPTDLSSPPDTRETVFYVRDNGPGIAAPDRERIFGLFERAESGHPGTGVGLAIVKRVVELHGGRIWVETEGPGTGSTFCFTLPGHPPGLVEAIPPSFG